MNIDELFNKQLTFVNGAVPDMVNTYISTYGKDAILMQQDREQSQKYSQVYGVDVIGYGFGSSNYKRIPIKVLIDISDWGHIVTNSADTDIRIIMKYVDNEIVPGDMIQFTTSGIQLNYRVQDNVEVYQRLFIKFNARLVMNKDIRDAGTVY